LKNDHQAFALGSLVVPAQDGELYKLGYDVETLGRKALGLVIDAKKTKAQVSFPELNVSVWLEHDEMADVEVEASKGLPEYQALLPDFKSEKSPEMVFWLWELCRLLDVQFVLGMESGEMVEVWDQEDHPLDYYYKGPVDVPVTYIGVGVKEFYSQSWERVQAFLGKKLLFSRILPSGMHKLEISIFLRRD